MSQGNDGSLSIADWLPRPALPTCADRSSWPLHHREALAWCTFRVQKGEGESVKGSHV